MKKKWFRLIQIRTWASKGGWTIVDQMLFSGTNFIVGVQLARWLPSVRFGAFSTAYSIFLLLSTLHTSMWTEPVLLYGSSVYRENFSAYISQLQKSHWMFSVVVGFVFSLTAFLTLMWGNPDMASALYGLAIGAPFVLYLWLTRRFCYAQLKPDIPVLGGFAYLLLYPTGVYFLFILDMLTPSTIFIMMGVTSGLSAVIITNRIWTEKSNKNTIPMSEVVVLHWRYGRWAVLAAAFWWMPQNLPFLILPIVKSFSDSGVLRAFYYLIMPVIQISWALESLFVPVYTRIRSASHLRFAVFLSATMLGGLAVLYWLLLYFFGATIVEWLYAGRYMVYTPLLNIISLLPIFVVLSSVLSALLRSLERPNLIAWSYGIGSASIIVFGYPLTDKLGVYGAAYSWVFGQLFILVNLILVSIKVFVEKNIKGEMVSGS